ncbi:hypothetical protein APHAL10511_007126 [Amanita phalloides]|nr:hypothetical protein APHAL10511_007126 [Amanita phalloides]
MVNPDEDTEFNDALRKHGILPPREPAPRTPSPPPPPTIDEQLDSLTISELDELDEGLDDRITQRVIEHYKRQRVIEERKKLKKDRFGRVYPIGRDDYKREVTNASEESEEGDEEETGTGVICFLYKDGIPRSDRAMQHVKILAERYPRTKFVSIVGDKCIPNLPDSRIPMLIIYKKGEIRDQIIAWGADRERRIEDLETKLVIAGAIYRPWTHVPVKSAEASTSRKNVRHTVRKDDSDSDFEFDL